MEWIEQITTCLHPENKGENCQYLSCPRSCFSSDFPIINDDCKYKKTETVVFNIYQQ